MKSAGPEPRRAAPIGVGRLALIIGLLAGASAPALGGPETMPGVDRIGVADRSVLRIIVRTAGGASMGSGFVVNDQHMLITNQHVVEGATGIIVLEPEGDANRPYPARLLAVDEARDLAVLVVPGLERAPLALRGAAPVKGERAVALGFPGVGERTMDILGDRDFTESARTTGEVSRLISEPWRPDQPALRLVQHTASINPGSSGGPLLDDCGRVIGVNTQIVDRRLAEGMNFASSVGELAAFLDEQGIAHLTSSGSCSAATLDASLTSILPDGDPKPVAKVVTVSAIAAALLVLLFWHYRRSVKAQHADQGRESLPAGRGPVSAETLEPEVPPAIPPAIVAAPERPRTLVVHGRTSDGRRFQREIRESDLLRGGILIGRDRTCSHVFVPDPGVSRRHARIAITDGCLTIEDLGSTNGTFLGRGRAIAAHSPMPIGLDTAIKIAKCTIRLSEKPA